VTSSTILHIPHSSSFIPPEYRKKFLLTEEELRSELLRMTDWYTDELFAPHGDMMVVRFGISRIVLDPERFEDDSQEIMFSRGMGIIYTKTSKGVALRNSPGAEERAKLIRTFYRPHHETIEKSVGIALANAGAALVIDCHSFPSKPSPYELCQNPERPQICIGTDDYHTPSWLTDLAVTWCRNAGLTTAINRPFAGALVPAKHYRRDNRVLSIMIEVNRSLYMNEETGERSTSFQSCTDSLRSLLLELDLGGLYCQ